MEEIEKIEEKIREVLKNVVRGKKKKEEIGKDSGMKNAKKRKRN